MSNTSLAQQKFLEFQSRFNPTYWSPDKSVYIKLNGKLEVLDFEIKIQEVSGNLNKKIKDLLNHALTDAGTQIKLKLKDVNLGLF